jgi:hypothetical protein
MGTGVRTNGISIYLLYVYMILRGNRSLIHSQKLCKKKNYIIKKDKQKGYYAGYRQLGNCE